MDGSGPVVASPGGESWGDARLVVARASDPSMMLGGPDDDFD